jgi:hypothetical protein
MELTPYTLTLKRPLLLQLPTKDTLYMIQQIRASDKAN